ncbi:helix-turn-helix domain-containing protein [Rhodobacteraceae bacterium]|nr:helix-turn-helix domain-containing protein [Paracoccaceae bacterium]|tara:strand:- start:259 stop:1017 length:759 start_codon:yes stop_codon:yes gene_type:complete
MAKVTRERGIDRAIDILDCLHHHRRPMVVNELATAMGAPRSTIYQMTKLLLDRAVLDSYSGGRIFLGRKLFLYGSAVPEQYSLIELSKPFIDELADELGERVELNGLVDWKQSILCVAPGKRAYFFPLNSGASYPLPLTSSGRFLIDGFDEETLRTSIPEEDYFRHGTQVMTLGRLMRDSQDAKARGYSVVSDLLDTHMSSISMPIIDKSGVVLSTIGVAFPTGEMEVSKDRFVEALKETVTKVREKFLMAG